MNFRRRSSARCRPSSDLRTTPPRNAACSPMAAAVRMRSLAGPLMYVMLGRFLKPPRAPAVPGGEPLARARLASSAASRLAFFTFHCSSLLCSIPNAALRTVVSRSTRASSTVRWVGERVGVATRLRFVRLVRRDPTPVLLGGGGFSAGACGACSIKLGEGYLCD